MNTQQIIRNLKLTAIVMVASFTGLIQAEELKNHNAYTVLGHQLRSNLITQSPFGDDKPVNHGPTLFQEIRPCRFISTLEADGYPAPWGGKEFNAEESRTYYPIGVLRNGDWVNPCSEVVDPKSIAVALRIMAFDPEGNGAVYLAPSTFTSYSYPAVEFQDAIDAMREADVALHAQGFRVQPNKATHLVIDIIGYFWPDPNGYGAMGPKGDNGDRGEKGEQGQAGAQGLKGDKGDRGEAGAQGEKGERGEAGAQGLKGDKGEAGAQGEKGERGEAGAQGLKGDKGEAGAQGLQGERGERGEKGERGEAGAQGLKGDKGDNGAAGAQGAKGDKGDKGDVGPMGPQGPQGPAGQNGGGVSMITGVSEFPPPGKITISHPGITSKSVILLIYINVSNGNALGTESQTNGSFVATGSPNKAFRWVAFNMN